MWCCKCNKQLHECTCPDIQDRLAKIGQISNLAIQWCAACDKHHLACRCSHPDWAVKLNGQIMRKKETSK